MKNPMLFAVPALFALAIAAPARAHTSATPSPATASSPQAASPAQSLAASAAPARAVAVPTPQARSFAAPAARTSAAPAAQVQSPAEKEIIAAMNAATVQWNKGDLDAYMSLYDPAATMMLSSGRVGLDSIRGMYVKYYFPGGHPKQELAYDTYQLTMLGKDYALLTGRFILKANDKYPERKGTFSLTMVHRKDGWKILHDHSG